MARSPVLKVDNFSIYLRRNKGSRCTSLRQMVHSLSFEIYEGETLAIIGESGSGKSLTAQGILQLLPEHLFACEGAVYLQEQIISSLSAKQMRPLLGSQVSMIFQNPRAALNPVYTVGYQIKETARTHTSLSDAQIDELILQVLSETGFHNPKHCVSLYPHQMSGGMLQRICIAMALITSPVLLIADEPTTALDVSVQYQILQLLKDIQKKTNLAILFITHDIRVVAEMAQKILVLFAGRAVEKASVHDVFEHPAHPYTQALLHAHRTATVLSHVCPESVAVHQHGCPLYHRCLRSLSKCEKHEPPTVSVRDHHLTQCWLYDC